MDLLQNLGTVDEHEGFVPPGSSDGDYDDDSLGVLSRSDMDLGSEGLPGRQMFASPGGRKIRRVTKKASSGSKKEERDNSSRARQRKPHEANPFLSVDNLPVEKKDGQNSRNPSRAENNDRQTALNSRPTSGALMRDPRVRNLSSQQSNRRSQLGSRMSSEWNTLVPRQHKRLPSTNEAMFEHPTNEHIKMPFKQAAKPVQPKPVFKTKHSQMKPAHSDPAQILKEQTAVATNAVARSLAKQKPTEEVRRSGKLLKGKLKPLYPVSVQGPKIQHCRGIVTETRKYGPSPSRTLTRRREVIMNQLAQEYNLLEHPGTVESVHQTSAASDASDNRVAELHAELLEIELQDAERIRVEAEAVARASGILPPTKHEVEATQPENGQMLVPPSAEVRNETSATGDAKENKPLPVQDSILYEKAAPKSAQRRPKTVHELATRKAVRFADVDSSEPMRRAKSAMPRLPVKDGGEAKSRAKSATARCKPDDDKPTRHSDNDDDHDDKPDNDNSRQRTAASGEGQLFPSGQAPATDSNDNNSQGHKGQTGGKQAKDTEELRVSYNSLSFSDMISMADDREDNASSSITRPRGHLGCWALTQQPDEDIASLAVFGNFQPPPDAEDMDITDEFITGRKSTENLRRSIQDGRPQSARASTLGADRMRLKQSKRPISAHTRQIIPDDDPDLVIRPETSHSQDAHTVGRISEAVRNQRPVSGIALALTPRTAAAQEGQGSGLEIKVSGEKMAQSVKTGQCSQCNRYTTKIAIYSEDFGVLVCDVCDRANKSKIQRMKKFAATAMEGQVDEDSDELEGDEMVTDNVEELDKMLTELEEKKKTKNETEKRDDEENNKKENAASESLFSQMALLEKSLCSVQDEIRQCIEDAHTAGKEAAELCEKEEEIIEPELSADKEEKYEEEENKEESIIKDKEDDEENGTDEVLSAQFSQMLTGKAPANSYQMKVYHFWQGAKSGSRTRPLSGSRPSSGTRSGSRPSSGTRSGSRPSSGQLQKRSSSSDITSYNVTMVKDGGEEIGHLKNQETANQNQNGNHDKTEKDVSQLQIVATQALSSHKSDNLGGSIAPHPPLCFKVNARPPLGKMYYFAYGTDMNPHRMSAYLRREVTDRLWGLLFGFKLVFNKRGVDSEAGGFPNIEFNAESSVEGCLYLISQHELQMIDNCVGYPDHFEHVMLPLWMLNCSDPDNYGIAQYCVPALVYVAQDGWIHRGEGLQNAYAVDQCLQSADLLSPAYQQQLSSLRVASN